MLNEKGVSVFGFPVGLTPTIRDFELAFEGELIRNYQASNQRREQKICDKRGISWLVDFITGTVLWLTIRLEPVRHRKTSDADPSGFFLEKIRIGQYTVQGPFSFEIGELVRKVSIPGLEVRLIPGERRVRAITIGFLENEKRLKT